MEVDAETGLAAGVDADRVDLIGFRQRFYDCLDGWSDALFELCDAVLCSPTPVGSVPSLSLEPVFRRSHGSLYKALANGRIDTDGLRRLLVDTRPQRWPAVFAVDASTWDRCDAETSPERGFYYSASKHSNGQPIVAGWSYQWICQLDWAPDSWTAPIDARRIGPRDDTVSVTIEQIDQLVGLLNDNATNPDDPAPMFVFDAGYDPVALTVGLADINAQILVRISPKRVFHPDPAPHTPNSIGRPRRHGERFVLSDPATWTVPNHTLTANDSRYGTVNIRAWSQMHPKLHGRGRWADHAGLPPIVPCTIIRVEVEHLPKPTSNTTKTLWLWWSGPGLPDLNVCWRAYLRRFDIEHTFRFIKNTLGWTTPSICTPDQADRWTWLTLAAYTQLRLARRVTNNHRRPWERPRQPHQLSPARVRRGFRQLRQHLDTPAHPPKSTKPGPGRPKGTRKPPRTRHPAIRKAS